MPQRLFFAGKGGVGKTTVAAAVAVRQARAGRKTLLLTTDPAAHTGFVLGITVGEDPVQVPEVANLSMARIDPAEATARYQAAILRDAEAQYSPDTVDRLREELKSPCTEEVAVFRRFLWALLTPEYETVVFDTAPTGHTLRLLSLPLSYQRQLQVKAAGTETTQAADDAEAATMAEALTVLRDPVQTRWAWVVYPEATPIREAARGAAEMAALGIGTGWVVVNQVLPEAVCVHPLFRARYAMQQQYVASLADQFPDAVQVSLPLMPTDVVGIASVAALGDHLPPIEAGSFVEERSTKKE
ncbi:MAG: ArsA family ATPase [Clostridia bacterium]